MGIEGLSEVPSPPALPDLYDGLGPDPELELDTVAVGSTAEPTEGVSGGHVSVTAAGILALILSAYGFWVGISSLRAWLLPSPFCDPDCRLGVAYGVMLLVPAAWGCLLGGALIRRWHWARVWGAATFALFALENLVRLEPRVLWGADVSLVTFRYQFLFAAMFVLNAIALGLLLGRGARLDLEASGWSAGARGVGEADVVVAVRTADVRTADVRGVDVRAVDLGLDEQVRVVDANRGVEGGETGSGRPAIVTLLASLTLMSLLVWYRVPDMLLHFDFAGVFVSGRARMPPRWLVRSPAVSLALGWGFLLAFGLLWRRRWALVPTIATCSVFFFVLLALTGVCIGAGCIGSIQGIELTGLVVGNALVIGLLATKSARRDFSRRQL